MRRIITFTIMFIITIMLSACNSIPTVSGQPKGSPDESSTEPVKVITLKMNGETIEVKEGDIFQVSIPTIPTEGYNWEPESLDTSILVQQGESLYQQNQGVDEAGGNVILTFKAVGKGTTPLSLIYTQPRENNPNAMYSQSFGVTIVVK